MFCNVLHMVMLGSAAGFATMLENTGEREWLHDQWVSQPQETNCMGLESRYNYPLCSEHGGYLSQLPANH